MNYPFSHKTSIRVNYFDTDKMGVVWHGNYIKYFEIAREEMFRNAGLSYAALEQTGIMMPVVEVGVTYLKPAEYDEILTVESVVETAPGARIRIAYTVSNPAGEINATGFTVLAFINAATRRPCRPPAELRGAKQP